MPSGTRSSMPCSSTRPTDVPDVEVLQRDDWSAADHDRLLACCDCYVSLHRADGGLGAVAKAMSWGTFTVVTATAASLEFQTDEDSGLVRCESTPVPADVYGYPSGAAWADPDLEHASSILRSVVADPGVTTAKVRRAQRVAARRFSSSAAAATVRARLAEIDAHLHPDCRTGRVAATSTRRDARACR